MDALIIHGLWQRHGLAVWRALHDADVPYFMYFHGMLDPRFKHRYPLKHLNLVSLNLERWMVVAGCPKSPASFGGS